MLHQIRRNQLRSLLVVTVFLAIWMTAGWLAGWLVQQLTVPSAATIPWWGAAIMGALGVLVILLGYFYGDYLALSTSSAQPADPVRHQQLLSLVGSLAYGARIRIPIVYVINDPAMNAFATGRSPNRASIVVTTGLLNQADREQLEGVLAHEICHIRDYDVFLILTVTLMVGAASVISDLCFNMARVRAGTLPALGILTGIVFGLLGAATGPLMQLGLSRSRESHADASAVELTRNPQGLLRALQMIAAGNRPLRTSSLAITPMLFDSPFEGRAPSWSDRLFDTHPPIRERIAALQRIAQVQET